MQRGSSANLLYSKGRLVLYLTLVAMLFSACDPNPAPLPTPTLATVAPTPEVGALRSDAGISLVISPGSINFTRDVRTRSVFLSSSPSGRLEWRVTQVPDWVTVSPVEGLIDKNIVEVKITVKGTPPDVRSDELSFISSGGVGSVVLNRDLADTASQPTPTTAAGAGSASPAPGDPAPAETQPAVQSQPQAEVSLRQVEFPASSSAVSVVLTNTGSVNIDWSVASSDAWITVEPQSGSIAPGQAAQITVKKDESQAPSPSASGFITISSTPAGVEIKLPVRMVSTAVQVLDHRVIQAEYNEETDKVITISANPSRLNIIDPATGQAEHIALPATPNCVSVQADGAYAAVGHNAHVSYVDLQKKAVERTYPISSDVKAIALTGNGRVYTFPASSEVDLKSGGVSAAEGRIFRDPAVVRVHPSDNYLYSADTGISPDDITKFDISSGRLTHVGDSPYHGDYRMGGNIWISADGTRIFVASGTVLRSSSSKDEDMVYGGQLEGVSGLRWVATSTDTGRIFALDGGSHWGEQAPGLRIYDSEYLNYLGIVDLPPFQVPAPAGTREVASQGYGVFVNSAKGKVHVLLNADPGGGLQRDWAIATFDIKKFP